MSFISTLKANARGHSSSAISSSSVSISRRSAIGPYHPFGLAVYIYNVVFTYFGLSLF